MTAKLFNLQKEREARTMRAAEELRKGKSIKQIIHGTTYVPKKIIVAEKVVTSLFERLKGIKRGNASELVDCVLCQDPISGVTSNDLTDYEYYADGGGPLHQRCYNETYSPKNLKRAEEWAERNLEILNRLRDY